jgi:hypothetical protein
MQSQSAAAYPDPQPLLYPANFAEVLEDEESNLDTGKNHVGTDLPVRPARAQFAVVTDEDNPLDAARPRAASPTADTQKPADVTTMTTDPAAAAAPEGSPWREPWVSVTSTPKAPAGATDTPASPKKPPQPAPLSATQTKLLKKIIRRGPKHPQFKLAARLLDRHISTT